MPILGSRSLWTSAGTTLDPATTAWVAAVVANGGSVSEARKTIVNTLIVGLKADSVWSTKLDRFWLLAAENTASALTDLVGLTLATAVSSPTFTTDQGYTGDGSTNYLDTNFTPSTAGGLFTQDSAAYGFWVPSGTQTSGRCLMGVHSTSDSLMNLFGGTPGSSQMQAVVNDSGASPALSPANVSLPGFWVASRTASNVLSLYQNGAASGSGSTDASTANCDLSMFVLARDRGFADQFSDASVSAAFAGSGLSSIDVSSFYTRLRTYMTAIGVP